MPRKINLNAFYEARSPEDFTLLSLSDHPKAQYLLVTNPNCPESALLRVLSRATEWSVIKATLTAPQASDSFLEEAFDLLESRNILGPSECMLICRGPNISERVLLKAVLFRGPANVVPGVVRLVLTHRSLTPEGLDKIAEYISTEGQVQALRQNPNIPAVQKKRIIAQAYARAS